MLLKFLFMFACWAVFLVIFFHLFKKTDLYKRNHGLDDENKKE